jgi:3-hydroxybutyryl-CoA dehydratase
MGLYFEEFSLGQKITTETRTITESDIMTFAALSGDDNRIHTDPEFSKTTPFGKQIAHGILGLAIASGLAWQTGILDGTVIAFREINEYTLGYYGVRPSENPAPEFDEWG